MIFVKVKMSKMLKSCVFQQRQSILLIQYNSEAKSVHLNCSELVGIKRKLLNRGEFKRKNVTYRLTLVFIDKLPSRN